MAPVARLLVALFALVAFALPVCADGDVAVPDVDGRTVEKALEILESKGLEPRLIQVAGPEVDVVDSQRPEAGVEVPTGSPVFLRVGIRARIETELPDVIGRPVEDALELLAGAYDVHVTPRTDGSVAAGTVLASDPNPGERLYYRASLVLYIAESDGGASAVDEPAPVVSEAGPPAPVVPCCVGQTPTDAKKTLEEAGYKVRIEDRWAADAKAGHIVAQDPPADRPALRGAAVTIFLPEMAVVPSVVGFTHMDAVRELAAVGLATRFDPRPAGRLDARVVEQRPEPGQTAVVGSAVVLRFDDDKEDGGRVWNAPAPGYVVVPDVRGTSPKDARATLDEAGLSSTVDARGRETPGPVVTAMSHAPMARLRQGATITLIAGPFGMDSKGGRRGAFEGAVGIKPKPPADPNK